MKIETALLEIRNSYLRECSLKYLVILKDRGFDNAPASISFHHPYKGGLRDHTEEMLDIAIGIVYTMKFKEINLDHLLISIVFHDAGKTDYYIWIDDHFEHNRLSPAYEYDHAFVPVVDWEKIGFIMPDEVKQAILGHMGGWSVTEVYPDTLLGAIVASADLISSRMDFKGRKGEI